MRDGKPVYYEAMVKKIERYADLFKATHGGITFSGGESMMQPAFVSRVFHAGDECWFTSWIRLRGDAAMRRC